MINMRLFSAMKIATFSWFVTLLAIICFPSVSLGQTAASTASPPKDLSADYRTPLPKEGLVPDKETAITAVDKETISVDSLASPDKLYTVTIDRSALPGSDPDSGCYTIILARNGETLAKAPTIGYLLDAHWSFNGKYVAVNNRRENNGDYLWVFSLVDGRIIKAPDNGNVLAAIDRLSEKLPQYSRGKLSRGYIAASDWANGDKLKVTTRILFLNSPSGFISLEEVYRVEPSKLVRVDERVRMPETNDQ
jgi:hypothetical protein